MKYMLLIHQGSTPLPGSDEWESLPEEEKRAVLASEPFARSEQLRAFLSFVCEMEIAGRAAALSEYLILTGSSARTSSEIIKG